MLIGIFVATVAGIPFGVTHLPEGAIWLHVPPSLKPIFWKFDFSNVFSFDMLIVLYYTFLFVDMFDTVGTLVGVSSKARLCWTKEGKLPRVKQALFADSVGTTVGAILGH